MTTIREMVHANWNTDPYQMPEFVKAATVLLRLAQPFFYQIEFSEASPASERAMLENWRILRRISRLLLERGAMELTLAEACQLRASLACCPAGGDVAYLMDQTWSERS
jgi:hypothetical protein